MSGSWQHYLPACYLGGFSSSLESRARDRTLWVARRGKQRPYLQKAANVAARHDIYTLDDEATARRINVDEVWTYVERNLSTAIEHLVASRSDRIRADVWLRTLVSFAAHVLVRGVDFGPRFVERFERLFGSVTGSDWLMERVASRDNVNMARLFELQRVLGAVCRAEWDVVHAPEEVPLITADVGRTASATPYGQLQVAIPLRPDAALVLRNGDRRPIFYPSSGDVWEVAPIRHFVLTSSDASALNRATAAQALNECYTTSSEQAELALVEMGPNPPALELGEPIYFGKSSRDFAEHELLWHKMLSFVSQPPSVRVMDESLPEEVRESWRRGLGVP